MTVANLMAECADFAERDEKFLSQEHIETGFMTNWETDKGTTWRLGFSAVHGYEAGEYFGQSYLIQLTVTQELNYIFTSLRRLAAIVDSRPLPDNEDVLSAVFTHAAEYIIGHNVTLGWEIYNKYAITYYDREAQTEAEVSDDYDTEDEAELPLAFRQYSLPVELHELPDISQELELGDSYQDMETELLACADTEIHLRQAHAVFGMLDSGDESKFDLSMIFPSEIIQALGRGKSNR